MLDLLGRYNRGWDSPYMWDKVGAKNWDGPLLLEAANLTPTARTPWGGRRIAALKADAGVDEQGPVGESWELSVEPDFPSRLADGPLLDEVLRQHPSLLGKEAARGSTALLVKLVDAADDLSLQIHPEDDDPALEQGESGKPEAWYIVDAAPGAGLYLGFREGVTAARVRRAIDAEEAVDDLMSFVDVSPGDLFVIDPSTPHAIGKGVFLVEPQRVTPGKRGITYRYWDWNRRYDEDGRKDAGGKPRALHSERALEVTDWSAPREGALVDRIRYPGGTAQIGDSASLETLCSPTGPLRSEHFFIRRLAGSGRIELPPEERLRSLTVLDGRVSLGRNDTVLGVARGRTVALPASANPMPVELERAHAVVCALA